MKRSNGNCISKKKKKKEGKAIFEVIILLGTMIPECQVGRGREGDLACSLPSCLPLALQS